MKTKRTISLLLSLVMILSIFTVIPVVSANADAKKYKITYETEGLYGFVFICGDETERPTELEAGKVLNLVNGSIPYEKDYYVSDAYLINGEVYYGDTYVMPAHDVTISAVKQRRTKITLDLTDNEEHWCPYDAAYILMLDEPSVKIDMHILDQYDLFDLNESGAYDIRIDYESVVNPSSGTTYTACTIQRLSTCDATGRYSYYSKKNWHAYSPINLILSEDDEPLYEIAKPDYVRTANHSIGQPIEYVDEAEAGDLIYVYTYADTEDIGMNNYLTGEIFVDGVSLGTEVIYSDEVFVNHFIMPDHPVSITVATAQKQDVVLNLSDGKRHEFELPSRNYVYYSIADELGLGKDGPNGSFYLDVDKSGVYDILFTQEHDYDDDGNYLRTHNYAQMLEDADATGDNIFYNGHPETFYGYIHFVNVLSGDANNDGVVNVMDATRIQRYLAHFTQDVFFYAADANCDNYVEIIDVTIIQRRLVGLD